jgi:hypothetical protein
MKSIFKPFLLATFVSLAFGATAQDAGLVPVAASEVVLADYLYLKRPIVIFADSPNDPEYIRQMALLTRGTADLIERDVVVITDTIPNPPSELRKILRPRGFLLVLLDKDGTPEQRKPLPWDTREITHAIDKFTSRRLEVLERKPAGR